MKKLLRKIWRKITGSGYTLDELRDYGVKIGNNCHVLTTKIDVKHGFLISMGDNVSISDARLLTHDGSTKKFIGYSRVGRIDIGNNVFIGADAVILPGVSIGNNVIVGAGTIVTKSVPDNSLIVGNPGKVIGKVSDFVDKNRFIMESSGNVWKNHYSKKTEAEREEMFEKLADGIIGFDI